MLPACRAALRRVGVGAVCFSAPSCSLLLAAAGHCSLLPLLLVTEREQLLLLNCYNCRDFHKSTNPADVQGLKVLKSLQMSHTLLFSRLLCGYFWFSEQIVGCSNLNSEELNPRTEPNYRTG